MNIFYAIKQDQKHAFDTNGKRLLVTRLSAGTLKVVQVKSGENDGYDAIQVAIGSKKRVNQPMTGHLKSAGVTPRYLREVRMNEVAAKQPGEDLLVTEIVKVGDLVNISSRSKGKGFAGGVKRWDLRAGLKLTASLTACGHLELLLKGLLPEEYGKAKKWPAGWEMKI